MSLIQDLPSKLMFRGVFVRPEHMQRDVGFIADYPAVMSGRNIENIPGSHFYHRAVIHLRGRTARNDQADMLDGAPCRTCRSPDVQRPFPPRFISRPSNTDASDAHYLEFPSREGPDFVRPLKSLQNHVLFFGHPQLPSVRNMAPIKVQQS